MEWEFGFCIELIIVRKLNVLWNNIQLQRSTWEKYKLELEQLEIKIDGFGFLLIWVDLFFSGTVRFLFGFNRYLRAISGARSGNKLVKTPSNHFELVYVDHQKHCIYQTNNFEMLLSNIQTQIKPPKLKYGLRMQAYTYLLDYNSLYNIFWVLWELRIFNCHVLYVNA